MDPFDDIWEVYDEWTADTTDYSEVDDIDGFEIED